MWTKLIRRHLSMPAQLQTKVGKAALEMKAEDAAVTVVWHLGQEAMKLVPLEASRVQKEVYDKYVHGDPKLELEIQSLHAMKPPDATCRSQGLSDE